MFHMLTFSRSTNRVRIMRAVFRRLAPAEVSRYAPRGMSGEFYTGALAQLLTEVATREGYSSPHWYTAAGAERACMTIPLGVKGVTVHGHGKPFVLYNVQQGANHGPPIHSSKVVGPSQRSELDHRLLNNKLLPKAEAERCQEVFSSFFPIGRVQGGDAELYMYWGTQKDFIALGLRLRHCAVPLVDKRLFNVSQCEDPQHAIALIRRRIHASIKTLDGGVLPGDVSVAIRAKLAALKARATLVIRLLPQELSLVSALRMVSDVTPEYYGTEEQFGRFGTRLRDDDEFIAALTVLDAVGRVKITAPLQLKSMYSRALDARANMDTVRHLISVTSLISPSTSYYPSTLTVEPIKFNSFTCSRLLSPIHDDTNNLVVPIRCSVLGSTGESTSRTRPFSQEDIVTLLSYRLQHSLYKSRAWVLSDEVAQLRVGQMGVAATYGITASPCTLASNGVSYYNVEQLHGYEGTHDYEGALFKAVSHDDLI